MRLLLIICLLPVRAVAFNMDGPPTGNVNLAATLYYRPTRELVLSILKTYPPGQFHYVGLGRSPTPIIAMIQSILGESSATNLPLNGLKALRPADQVTQGDEFWRKLTYTSENLTAMHLHIERYLPSIDSSEGAKTMLFIDYAHTGATFINLKREMEAETASRPVERRRSIRYLAFAFGNRPELKNAGIDVTPVRGRALKMLDRMPFKHLSEYLPGIFRRWSEPPAEAQTLARLRKDARQEYLTSFLFANRHEAWAKETRRYQHLVYRRIEGYDVLRAALTRRTRVDPILTRDRADAPSTLRKLKHACETLLDHAIDGYYLLRYRIPG